MQGTNEYGQVTTNNNYKSKKQIASEGNRSPIGWKPHWTTQPTRGASRWNALRCEFDLLAPPPHHHHHPHDNDGSQKRCAAAGAVAKSNGCRGRGCQGGQGQGDVDDADLVGDEDELVDHVVVDGW